MSSPDVLNSQAAVQRKNASNTKRKSAGQPMGFTFVDQSADLRSIADKKIVDSDQRHLIRSHVMQKVRKDERMQGKKRPTGRDASRKCSLTSTAVSTSNSTSTPRSESPQSSTTQSDLDWNSPTPSPTTPGSSQSMQLAKIPNSPSQGRLDPFNTLPGGRELSKLTNDLITYCFHTFIPMTFPIESNSPREYNVWRVKVLQSQTANSATFFGLMAMVSVHQAINSGRHRDLRPSPPGQRPNDLLIDNDFALMKSQALAATQARIARNGWDGPTVEAIFSLVGAEQILGNFEEARFHLSALKKFFLQGEDLDPASPASNWIPLTDVKGAIGTMSRPLFRLPWISEPLPQETLEKLYNWHAPEMSLLASSFPYVEGLGPVLQALVHQAVVLCRFCQLVAVRNHAMTAQEWELFRRKSLELEYDILSYIYPGSPTDDQQVPNKINCIEQITRLAVLGITSTLITKVHPAAGVGRALTHFQSLAIQEYAAQLTTPPTKTTAQFIVWALVIFAQCASKQPEERHFINSIAWYSQWAQIRDWTALETVCNSFLYVPALQQNIWQQIWTRACQYHQADQQSQATMNLQSQPQSMVVRSQPGLGSTWT